MLPSIKTGPRPVQFSDNDDSPDPSSPPARQLSSDDLIESCFTHSLPVPVWLETEPKSDPDLSPIDDAVPSTAPRLTFTLGSDSDDERAGAGAGAVPAGRDDGRFFATFEDVLKKYRKGKKIDWERLTIEAVPDPPVVDARDVIRANRASALQERLRKEKRNRAG
jgi:hypothetical protein